LYAMGGYPRLTVEPRDRDREPGTQQLRCSRKAKKTGTRTDIHSHCVRSFQRTPPKEVVTEVSDSAQIGSWGLYSRR
jgi:hypothetical protein